MDRDQVIANLANGETVESYREGGNSMTPVIKSRQPVTIRPIIRPDGLKRGDIVLVRVRGSIYTHLIKGLAKGRVLIGNNHGRINGWTPIDHVYGIVTQIGDCSRSNSQYR